MTATMEADAELTLANLKARQARLDAAVLEAERKAAEAAIDAAAGRTQDERRAGRKGEDDLARAVAEARGRSTVNHLAVEAIRQEFSRRDRDLAEAMAEQSRHQNGERLRTLATDLQRAASELDALADQIAEKRMAYHQLADQFVVEAQGGHQRPDGSRGHWIGVESRRDLAVDLLDAAKLYPKRVAATEHAARMRDEHAVIPSAVDAIGRIQAVIDAQAIDLEEGR